MNPDACEKKIEEIRNSKNLKSVPPAMPVAIVMQEAINLYEWCKPDREILTGTGFDWKLAEDIPLRVEALGRLETLWATERLVVKEPRKEWQHALTQAQQLRADLLHHFRHAFRSKPDAKAKVKSISKGNTYAGMIQDLIELSELGRQYEKDLQAVGFDMSLLDQAYRMSFDLGPVYAGANSERFERSENMELRNKAYYHLKEAVDKLRKAGQYVFWQNEEKLKGYRSTHIRSRNDRYRNKKSNPPAPPAS